MEVSSSEAAGDLYGRSLPLVGQATDYNGLATVPSGYVRFFGSYYIYNKICIVSNGTFLISQNDDDYAYVS